MVYIYLIRNGKVEIISGFYSYEVGDFGFKSLSLNYFIKSLDGFLYFCLQSKMEDFYGYMKVVYLLYVGGLFKIFQGLSEVDFDIIIVWSVWKRIRV